ncbi:MAG TPA: BTAD domain-containing putative transcriptional regulator [Streptosporangiaceae bacterium]|nr:BTAD domain-containing putative transcriptional regulator [Streptosporangiaceae bacterium]
MRLAVLGPLLVHDGEAAVDVPKGRLRVLLAALLLHAGSPVAADALAEVVWDGAPPSGAAATLRSHVLRLRRALGPRAGPRLVTRPPGYLLQAGEDEVDVLQFRGLCRDGGAALRQGEWDRADRLLDEALGLWRGTALADVPSQLLRQDETPGLEELRLQAEEWRADAALHLGRHDELVVGLRSLAAKHPLRERFHAQLMLALYRCGRQAEALAAYQDARLTLIQDVGAEPGLELHQLHQQVLSADPALAAPEPASPARDAGPSVTPRELPPAAAHFTGRAQELAMLTGLLDKSSQDAPGTVVISAIGGTAGVGKTALAVHWAHDVAGRFPDGQLYVNLRGYDPDQPVSASDALAMFLSSLGVPGQDIPFTEDERAARYRSLLAGQRMLVLLDNARSAEQVRPLLPGSPGCMTLVTSRDSLAGLVARDGACRMDLDLLSPADALWLLRALIGARVDADPAGAAALAARCSRLPLALRVAAEFACSHPEVGLADLSAELADQQRQLDVLEAAGDSRTAVRAVFSWSYRHLSPAAAEVFRLLGLQPGPDLDLYATAALTGGTLEQARDMLTLLTRAYLVRPVKPGRYGMHDLLRAYARELASARQDAGDQQQALSRLADYYLSTAGLAMHALYPAEDHLRPRPLPAISPAPPVTAPETARAWLDEQLPCLVAVAAHAADHGMPAHATGMADTLDRYLYAGGHYPEAFAMYTCAMRAARRAGDRAGEAMALNGLGGFAWLQGHNERAADLLQQALTLFRQVGDQSGEGRTLGSLGLVDLVQGRSGKAADHFRQAAAMFRKTGDRSGEARSLGNLGVAERRQGHYQQAADLFAQALTLSRQTGDRTGEGYSLARLGGIESDRGHCAGAIDRLQRAVAIFRQTGDRPGEAYALTKLGVAEQRRGQYQQATEHHQQALTLCRETGERAGEAEALNGLGEALQATGQAGEARTRHEAALQLACQVGDKLEQARAHNGLGHLSRAAGDVSLARRHWHRALALYTGLGAPEADEILRLLASVE